MTTARDVLAAWAALGRSGTPYEWADSILAALLSAPDSVRLELVGMLNPWRPAESAPKDGNPFLAELCGNTYAVVFRDENPDHGMHVWPTEDGIRYHRDALTRWMPLLLPAPPSEDKPK